jgi:hypothetical protein
MRYHSVRRGRSASCIEKAVKYFFGRRLAGVVENRKRQLSLGGAATVRAEAPLNVQAAVLEHLGMTEADLRPVDHIASLDCPIRSA